MIRETKGTRRYTDPVVLTKSVISVDDYGHKSVGETTEVMKVYALVRQMSATTTMLTFQQADVVGLDVEFRAVNVDYDGLIWKGHRVNFAQPEDVDGTGMYTRLRGYYAVDNPDD